MFPLPLQGERARVRGLRLRRPLPRRTQNYLQHAIQISQNLVVPKPQHAVPLRLKELSPLHIACRVRRMLTPINLDDERLLLAHKIRDVRPARVLPTEFESGKPPATHAIPDQAFRIGGMRP